VNHLMGAPSQERRASGSSEVTNVRVITESDEITRAHVVVPKLAPTSEPIQGAGLAVAGGTTPAASAALALKTLPAETTLSATAPSGAHRPAPKAATSTTSARVSVDRAPSHDQPEALRTIARKPEPAPVPPDPQVLAYEAPPPEIMYPPPTLEVIDPPIVESMEPPVAETVEPPPAASAEEPGAADQSTEEPGAADQSGEYRPPQE
jgi:hypothetical protein